MIKTRVSDLLGIEHRTWWPRAARGDTEGCTQFTGQTAGLIDSIQPAGELVREVVAETEGILRERLPTPLRQAS